MRQRRKNLNAEDAEKWRRNARGGLAVGCGIRPLVELAQQRKQRIEGLAPRGMVVRLRD
jgi:hypothetical protein